MVLKRVALDDDGAVDLCGVEAGLAQGGEDQQFEAVAIFLAAAQGALDGGPVVDAAVFDEDGLGLLLAESNEVACDLAAALLGESGEVGVGSGGGVGDLGPTGDVGSLLPFADLATEAVLAGFSEVGVRGGAGGVV